MHLYVFKKGIENLEELQYLVGIKTVEKCVILLIVKKDIINYYHNDDTKD